MASQARDTPIKDEKVTIIGSGFIGRSWAMLFASSGYNVAVYDVDPAQISDALQSISTQLKDLDKSGLLRGSLTVEQQYNRIQAYTDFKEAVSGAFYIQECVSENLELKRKVFSELDGVVGEDTIMASSTTSLPASSMTDTLTHRTNTLVAHPTNPPYFCPLVEVCPAPYTSQKVTENTLAFLRGIGQSPVLLKKEVTGFVLNRIQFALMDECWKLLQDDVISVEDLDKVVTEGFGLRYPFVGPMETIHLAAQGISSFQEKLADTIYNITSSFAPSRRWSKEEASRVMSEMEKKIPMDQLPERRRRRDACIMAVAKLKKDMEKEWNS